MFFDLIKVAVGKATALPRTPTEEEWGRLHEEARRQALMGVLFSAVEALPREQRPGRPMLLAWYTNVEAVEAANRKLDEATVWIADKFQQMGVRNAILKGQCNAQLYPRPERRQPGDVDIWLDSTRERIADFVAERFPQTKITWIDMDFPVRRDVQIEVHTMPSMLFCPTDNRRLHDFYNKHRDDIFTNRVELPTGAVSTPTWEVNVVFQMTHIYRHLFYEGIGLRQVMDYYYLLMSHKMTTEERNALNGTIDSIHLGRFRGALMWVLEEVFGLERERMLSEPDEEEGRFLLEEMMLAGNFGHHDERNTIRTSYWGNFWQITMRNTRFLRRYPREVLWNPWYRIRQFAWRKRRGYK